MANNACLRNRRNAITWAESYWLPFYLRSLTFYFHDYLYFRQLYYRDFVRTTFFFIIRSQTQSASVISESSFTNIQRPHPSRATAAFEKVYQMSSCSIPQGFQVFLLCRSGRMRHWSLSVDDTILQARTNPDSHLLSFSLLLSAPLNIFWVIGYSIFYMDLHHLPSPPVPSSDIAASSPPYLSKCT